MRILKAISLREPLRGFKTIYLVRARTGGFAIGWGEPSRLNVGPTARTMDDLRRVYPVTRLSE